MRTDLDNLKTLGKTTKASTDYEPAMLDACASTHPERDYWLTLTAP